VLSPSDVNSYKYGESARVSFAVACASGATCVHINIREQHDRVGTFSPHACFVCCDTGTRDELSYICVGIKTFEINQPN
jgi:hypothetical protein